MIDLFVDLSRCGKEASVLIEALATPDGLGAITAANTCLLAEPLSPGEAELPGWRMISGESAIVVCNTALEQAALTGRPLLVLLEPLVPGNEAVSTLVESLGRDDMFGFSMPRQSHPRGGIRKLAAEYADREVEAVPRRVLGELPDLYILPEFVSACFLVRKELVANLGLLDESFQTLAGAWLHYMCRARRIGFRCVMVNTAVVVNPEPGDSCAVAVDKDDFWKLHRIYPDITLAREQLSRLPAHGHENLLARALDARPELSKTLLIDARGMGPGFNGTVHCALGLLEGLSKLNSGWRMALLAHSDAIAYHGLAKRFPDWDMLDKIQPRRFTVAFRISQPWAIETMAELHRLALFNFYSMLDTIAWDVVYTGIKRLEETWGFLSDHADGVVYISDFTGRRFRTRFPLAPGVRDFTHYLSFHPDDYVPRTTGRQAEEAYVLLIGNDLDHKHIPATVELLTSAFPFQSFQVLGCGKSTSPQVTVLPSGFIPEEQIELLYARAKAIVFPSFYEGFGFPMIKGLSYGRTVIARRSDLLLEVAARHRSKGRLIAFETPSGLVEAVGRVLHGLPVEEVPLGTALQPGEEPMNWVAIARNLLAFIEETTTRFDNRRWLARDRAVRQFVTLQA